MARIKTYAFGTQIYIEYFSQTIDEMKNLR